MKTRSLIKAFITLLICTLSLTTAQARDYSQMYTTTELQKAYNIYSKNIHGMLFEDIAQHLTDDELNTLRKTRLSQPWNQTNDPFEFSASASHALMNIPTFSVKFLDDLAIAVAWYERHQCNKEGVFDYVVALDYSDMELGAPLPSLGVPDQAYKLDNFVDDVSQKTLKSALGFIVLHELGHIHHQHRLYSQISAKQAQAQEAEADQFALNVMRRMRLPPLGMSVWFLANSMRNPLEEGSPTQTHPLNSSRLRVIAQTIRNHPSDFIEPANRGRWSEGSIIELANEIERIGDTLADPDLRRLLRLRGEELTPDLLASACQGETHRQNWMDHFNRLFN